MLPSTFGHRRLEAISVNPLKAFVASLLVVPAVLLLAFGPRGTVVVPPHRVVVTYWEKWTGHEGAQMKIIVDDFNRTVGAQKGIYVRYVTTSTINQKTLIATAAGVPPDVAGLWQADTVQYASQDALEPLEKLAAAHGIASSYYLPVYWKMCNWHGHLWGLVSTPAAIALHYRKDVLQKNAEALRKAGLDPNRPPQTLAELDAYAKALTIRNSNGSIKQAGFLPTVPGWYVTDTYMWFGGHIWDAKTQKFTLTSPKVVAAFKWVQSYSKEFGKDAVASFQSGLGNFDSPQNPFLTGQIAMERQGPWMANYIYNLKPSMSTALWPKPVEMTKPFAERQKNYDWAVAPFPSADGRKLVSFCDCDVLVIPRGAKHKQAAFEFIAYVNRQDVMEKLCMMHSKNSPLAKVSRNFMEHSPNPYIKVFEALARSPNAEADPQIPIFPEVSDELNTMVQKLSLLQDTPRHALAVAQARLQHEYDLYKTEQIARGNKNY